LCLCGRRDALGGTSTLDPDGAEVECHVACSRRGRYLPFKIAVRTHRHERADRDERECDGSAMGLESAQTMVRF
jgi:hypothetical protein